MMTTAMKSQSSADSSPKSPSKSPGNSMHRALTMTRWRIMTKLCGRSTKKTFSIGMHKTVTWILLNNDYFNCKLKASLAPALTPFKLSRCSKVSNSNSLMLPPSK